MSGGCRLGTRCPLVAPPFLGAVAPPVGALQGVVEPDAAVAINRDPEGRRGACGCPGHGPRKVDKSKLYSGIGVTVLGMLVMWGESAVPWFFHLAIVLFVWGGVLIGMALRGQ